MGKRKGDLFWFVRPLRRINRSYYVSIPAWMAKEHNITKDSCVSYYIWEIRDREGNYYRELSSEKGTPMIMYEDFSVFVSGFTKYLLIPKEEIVRFGLESGYRVEVHVTKVKQRCWDEKTHP